MSTTAATVGRLVTYYGTGSGALSEVVAPGDGFRVLAVMVHFNAAPTTAGSLSVTFTAEQGSAYATILNSRSMVGQTDYVWQPPADLYLVAGDALTISYTNADSKTYGLLVQLENV